MSDHRSVKDTKELAEIILTQQKRIKQSVQSFLRMIERSIDEGLEKITKNKEIADVMIKSVLNALKEREKQRAEFEGNTEEFMNEIYANLIVSFLASAVSNVALEIE